MAKNINSVSFTILLVVLLVASTGNLTSFSIIPCSCTSVFLRWWICQHAEILKTEAQTFCFECGPVPFLGTNADCFNCCKTKYGSPPVVSGVVEGSEKHCHCYCWSLKWPHAITMCSICSQSLTCLFFFMFKRLLLSNKTSRAKLITALPPSLCLCCVYVCFIMNTKTRLCSPLHFPIHSSGR